MVCGLGTVRQDITVHSGKVETLSIWRAVWAEVGRQKGRSEMTKEAAVSSYEEGCIDGISRPYRRQLSQHFTVLKDHHSITFVSKDIVKQRMSVEDTAGICNPNAVRT